MSKFSTHRTSLQLVVNNSNDKMIVLTFALNIINESFSIKMNTWCETILLKLETNLDFDCTLTLRTQNVKVDNCYD